MARAGERGFPWREFGGRMARSLGLDPGASDARLTALGGQVEQLRSDLDAANAAIASQRNEIDALHCAKIAAEQTVESFRRDLETLRQAQAAWCAATATAGVPHARYHEIDMCMRWIAHVPVPAGPLVSVVLPTRDRCAQLQRAIASLLAQEYGHWEALVVDDGSGDETRAVLATYRDKRIRVLEGAGAGVCAARNVALDAARGDLIAYLDDDNMMLPIWLKSIVWAMGERPDADVLYGAFLIDDARRVGRDGRGDLPSLFFRSYDHRGVLDGNVADIGCIAHRAGLEGARFDESLIEMGDWDIFLRLTAAKAPLVLPVVACLYTTDAPRRLTKGPSWEADAARVREKNRSQRLDAAPAANQIVK